MSRSPFEAQLSTLCTEAERAAVSLRALPQAWPHFARVGVDAEGMIAGLFALAERGNEAEAEKDAAEGWLAGTSAASRQIARRYYDELLDARALVRGLRVIVDPGRAAALAHEAEAMRLTAPRLQGAVDQVRRLCAELRRPDHVLLTVEAGRELAERFFVWEQELGEAYARRREAERRLAVAGVAARQVRRELQGELRRLREVWDAARQLSGEAFPSLVFELAAAEVARRVRAAAAREATTRRGDPPTASGIESTPHEKAGAAVPCDVT